MADTIVSAGRAGAVAAVREPTFFAGLAHARVTNAVRTSISTMLRLLKRPIRYIKIDLPPAFSGLEPGQTIHASHRLIPEIETFDGKLWKLVPLLVVAVTDAVQPAKITLTCIDLREHYCTWWSPMLTDIGMTRDLNGIAIIDRGGGWETTRNQLAYGERPGGDNAYQEVVPNAPIVDRYGLLVQGGSDTNLLLNSTFSEGSGNAFTNWTPTTSGSAIAVEWRLYTLVHAEGFQRAVQFATYGAAQAAYLSQTVADVDDKLLYVRVYYKDGGAYDRMVMRAQRSSDSQWWRDSDQTWQGTAQDNTITPGTGVINSLIWTSKLIDLTGVTTDITISVGHFSAASAQPQISQLQGVELIEQTVQTGPWCRFRSPLPTKAATVQRVSDIVRIDNGLAVRVVFPTRGYAKATIRPEWSHADLLDGQKKYLWAADFDENSNSEYLRCYYQRVNSTNGGWRLLSSVATSSPASVAVSGAALATRGTEYTIACRWTSEAQNEHGVDGQALDIWADGVRGTQVTNLGTPVADDTCGVYLGGTPNDGNTENEADGHLTSITFGEHCPTEAELLRM